MLLQTALLLALAVATAASPILVARSSVTVPLTRHFNFTGSAKIAERDRVRAKAFKAGSLATRAVEPVPVTNAAVSYTATVSTESSHLYHKC